jgi:hypothetical protein
MRLAPELVLGCKRAAIADYSEGILAIFVVVFLGKLEGFPRRAQRRSADTAI